MRTTRSFGVDGFGLGCRVGAAVLASAAGLALCAGSAACHAGQPGGNAAVSADAGFGGVELPVPLVVGELRLSGRRGWVWRIPEGVGPETIRVVLDGDVDTVIGPNRLVGRRASLWLKPVGVGGVGDASGVYEVFGYYEEVESPGGPAGFSMSADKLPVQALIATTSPVRLSVDLRTGGRPDSAGEAGMFVGRADVAFAEALAAIRDPESVRPAGDAEPEERLRPPAWLLNRRVLGEKQEDSLNAGEAERGQGEPAGDDARGEGEVRRDDAGERRIPFSRDREPGRRADVRPPAAPAVRPDETETGEVARADGVGDRDDGGAVPGAPSAGADVAGEAAAREPGVAVDPSGVGLSGADRSVVDQSGPDQSGPDQPGADSTADAGVADAGDGAVIPDRIFSSSGVFFFSAGERIALERGDEANALTMTGGVVVQHEGADRSIEMTARRAVVFLEPGPLSETLGSFDVSDVIGVYLEGGVRVTDGSYTMRSPRVYYDVRADRAVLIDAVFRTYDDRLKMPLYMRADVVRQESSKRFNAEKATYANTAFATPHLSVGTSSMTLEERVDDEGRSSAQVDAKGITLRGGGVPFFWFPRFKGDPERFPLRSIGVSDTNRTGTVVRTAWDPFALLGIEAPEGLSTVVDIDYYADRGLGLGVGLEWTTPDSRTELEAAILPDDDGTDVMRNGREIERDDDTRAFAAFRHRWRFRQGWIAQLEGFHASDEAVLPALYRDIGVDSEELTTRAMLRRLTDESVLTLELKGLTTDFLPNEHAAQSPGYAVDKLPEIGFAKIGDDPLEEWAPEILTHTWNIEYSRMRLRFQEITPEQVGVTGRLASNRAFGVDPDVPIADAFRGLGLDEAYVNRLDTRQELSSAVNLGPVKAVPFVVGRFTAYDTSFDSFSPGEEDQARLWGSAGLTLSTSINRIDDGVESRTFDLHRMRHIIEPSITVWQSGSTIDAEDLPVYDDDVEGLADGTGFRGGINQTWQTKRGGPGRWRNVDVFTLDAEYVWFSDDVERETEIGRWYGARPELSVPDEFVRVSGTWQVTEVVGLTGETIWDVEDSREDRNSAGMLIRHSERFASKFEYRQIEFQDDTYGDAMFEGLFGDKYAYEVRGTYNFRVDDFQAVSFTLMRAFPNGMLGGSLTYNNISGETSFGVVIQPTGMQSSRSGGFGSSRGGGFGG